MLRVFLLLFFMLRPRCLPAIERGPVAAQPGAEASGAATDGPSERWDPPGVLCQGFAKAPLVVHPRASDARTRTALSLGESASSHFAVTAPLTLPSPPPLSLPLYYYYCLLVFPLARVHQRRWHGAVSCDICTLLGVPRWTVSSWCFLGAPASKIGN